MPRNELNTPTPTLPDWPVRTVRYPIKGTTVQLWAWSLATSSGEGTSIDAVASNLSADERNRANRFHFDRDRQRFIAARAGLRALLGAATQTAPEQVRFVYAEFGKPSLAGGAAGLRFNLSHTGDLALAALTVGDEVGIDIEAHRPCAQAEAIARRHFTPDEATGCQRGADEQRLQRFFDLWAAKESVIKLLGSGLRFPLTAFETPAAEAATGEISLPADNPLRLQSCWLQRVGGITGCSSALATTDEPTEVLASRLDPALLFGA
ncbi:MAG: 4'-phosphopantetheinyl transferase superfamily protein [Planctomycetota bacterium]